MIDSVRHRKLGDDDGVEGPLITSQDTVGNKNGQQHESSNTPFNQETFNNDIEHGVGSGMDHALPQFAANHFTQNHSEREGNSGPSMFAQNPSREYVEPNYMQRSSTQTNPQGTRYHEPL